MTKFMDIGSEIWHEAFSLFSLIVIHVARGKRIALAPAVLASIYRDMTLLKGKIAESTLLRIPKGKHDGLTVELWSSMHLVQVGVWKRFGELRRPGPNLMKSGYPRMDLENVPPPVLRYLLQQVPSWIITPTILNRWRRSYGFDQAFSPEPPRFQVQTQETMGTNQI
ncbi:hypothetical protein POTOM_003221 [Populus tomentosa]|uniref:Aminotransferase-like plant mobile domain-containing protein n=1 Tax=Populus tomentosa TaxID=118781 RepID=A0A8X8DL41_POPTO|nr:hypothetical protein POTOM_003221 [Populus tomentosa]